MGQDRLGVGSDLVDDMTGPSEYTIGSHYHKIDTALLHQCSCGIVGNHGMPDSLLSQFPSGEYRPLAARTRLITEHRELPSLLSGLIHGSGRRTHIDESKPTRVAVGQYRHAVPDEMGAQATDRPTLFDVSIGKSKGGFEGQFLLSFNGTASGHRLANLTQGIDRVHSSRSGAGKNLMNPIEVSLKGQQPLPLEGPRSLCQPIGRRGPDRSGPADHHVADRRCRFLIVAHPHPLEQVWKQPLLDQNNRIVGSVEINGSEVTEPAPDHDIQRGSA